MPHAEVQSRLIELFYLSEARQCLQFFLSDKKRPGKFMFLWDGIYFSIARNQLPCIKLPWNLLIPGFYKLFAVETNPQWKKQK